MKKSLLFLGLLGFAASAQAQGPWTQVNNPSTNIFSSYNVLDIHTLSPTLMWGVLRDRPAVGAPAAAPASNFVVTNNSTGLGDQYDIGSVGVTGTATLSNISGISATTAVACAFRGANYVGPATYGGEILKTVNGGNSWVKKTGNGFNGGFCNWVHMFNATVGVALGDPTGGAFEILRTTDGGETWNRLTTGIPTPLTDEYGNAGAFFALGNTIWAGMANDNRTAQVRVLKSTDMGLTWTASALTPITYLIAGLAFKNANEGIAYNYDVANGAISSASYARTVDGGATWTSITPNNTATGSFFLYDIDAVNGRYYTVGERFPASTTYVPEEVGSSTSTDGVNWTNMTTGAPAGMGTLAAPGFFLSMDLIPGPTAATTVGYGGLYTSTNGESGLYKFSRTVTATRDAALQSALSVYPNPSATGVFNVALGTSLKSNAQLIVTDALGRQVKAQALTASAVGSQKLSLDLTGNKAGVYTLQIRTEAGIATQKIVIE